MHLKESQPYGLFVILAHVFSQMHTPGQGVVCVGVVCVGVVLVVVVDVVVV